MSPPLFGPGDVARFRALAASIRVAPAIKEYVVDLVRATRDPAAYGLARPAARAGSQPAGHDRPGPRRPGPCPALRPRLCDPSRRQEPGPRHHAPPDPRQLRGRRRGPLRRRPPPAGSSTTSGSPERATRVLARASDRIAASVPSSAGSSGIAACGAASPARPSRRPRRGGATLIACEIVNPAMKAPSSFRRYSMRNRVIGYAIISSPITSPSRRRRG